MEFTCSRAASGSSFRGLGGSVSKGPGRHCTVRTAAVVKDDGVKTALNNGIAGVVAAGLLLSATPVGALEDLAGISRVQKQDVATVAYVDPREVGWADPLFKGKDLKGAGKDVAANVQQTMSEPGEKVQRNLNEAGKKIKRFAKDNDLVSSAPPVFALAAVPDVSPAEQIRKAAENTVDQVGNVGNDAVRNMDRTAKSAQNALEDAGVGARKAVRNVSSALTESTTFAYVDPREVGWSDPLFKSRNLKGVGKDVAGNVKKTLNDPAGKVQRDLKEAGKKVERFGKDNDLFSSAPVNPQFTVATSPKDVARDIKKSAENALDDLSSSGNKALRNAEKSVKGGQNTLEEAATKTKKSVRKVSQIVEDSLSIAYVDPREVGWSDPLFKSRNLKGVGKDVAGNVKKTLNDPAGKIQRDLKEAGKKVEKFGKDNDLFSYLDDKLVLGTLDSEGYKDPLLKGKNIKKANPKAVGKKVVENVKAAAANEGDPLGVKNK